MNVLDSSIHPKPTLLPTRSEVCLLAFRKFASVIATQKTNHRYIIKYGSHSNVTAKSNLHFNFIETRKKTTPRSRSELNSEYKLNIIVLKLPITRREFIFKYKIHKIEL